MERVFRLDMDLECLPEIGGDDIVLPEGALVMEPHLITADEVGADWVFLASVDDGQTWREYRTILPPSDEFPATILATPDSTRC